MRPEGGQDWFSSDHHFGHRNIIQFCHRPFRDVNDMDQSLIEIWNSVVMPGDIIYYLGDFSFYPPQVITGIVAKLNGYKVLIRGNHDRGLDRMLECGFDEAYTRSEYQGYRLIHNAEKDPEVKSLCGHVHLDWVRKANSINVGVDVWKYRPVSFSQLVGDKK